MPARPAVSVIVPFLGDDLQLAALLETLAGLELAPGDEVIVADNRQELDRPAADASPAGPIRVRPALGVRSPGYARNRAVAAAGGEWLVLIDADTEPAPTLLDDYFSVPPDPRTAVLAGAIDDAPGAQTPAARHAAARGQMSHRATLERGPWSYAQTANCALRRSAFVAIGGFDESARTGEDADLCFRLALEGWTLEARPGARVTHRTRESARGLLTQLARHGAGAGWLNRRYPGSFPPPRPVRFAARLARGAQAAAGAAAHGDPGAARAALLEVAEACAFEGGRLLPNHAPHLWARRRS